MYHVCARQSEIPWPKSLEWVRNTSIHARVLPEPRDMHRLAAEGLLHMAERLADPFRNATHNTLWEVSQEHGRKLLACWKLYDDVDGKYMFALLQFLRSNAFVRASLWKPSTKTILSLFACVLVCIICWHVGFFNSTFLACF